MKKPPLILTVTLNPAIDKVAIRTWNWCAKRSFQDPRILNPNFNSRVRNFSGGKPAKTQDYLGAGGKGINVSRALKNLGLKTLALGIIGGTTGRLIQDQLDLENIPHDFLNIPHESRTNLTFINLPSRQVRRRLTPGPKVGRKEAWLFASQLRKHLKPGRWIVFSGRNLPGIPGRFLKRLIFLAIRRKMYTCLDTSGESFKEGLLARPFLIKPNLKEAEEAMGRRLNSLLKLKKAIQYWHRQGIRVVCMTLGRRGALASDGQQMWMAMPPFIKVLNNVGCGDTLLAGFITSFCQGKSLPESLRFAVACAAANGLTLKPAEIRRKDLKSILPKIKMKMIEQLK